MCVFRGVCVWCGQGPSSVLLVSTLCCSMLCQGLWHRVPLWQRFRWSACWGYNDQVWGCMWWLLLWLAVVGCKGRHVTLWCPVFLQKEEVGVCALTESWTCCRPYTNTASIYKQNKHAILQHSKSFDASQIHNKHTAKYHVPAFEGFSLIVEVSWFTFIGCKCWLCIIGVTLMWLTFKVSSRGSNKWLFWLLLNFGSLGVNHLSMWFHAYSI